MLVTGSTYVLREQKGTSHVRASCPDLPDWFFHDTSATSTGTYVVLHHKAADILSAVARLRHTLFDTEPRCLSMVTAASTKMASQGRSAVISMSAAALEVDVCMDYNPTPHNGEFWLQCSISTVVETHGLMCVTTKVTM